jgi:hypothetical protein
MIYLIVGGAVAFIVLVMQIDTLRDKGEALLMCATLGFVAIVWYLDQILSNLRHIRSTLEAIDHERQKNQLSPSWSGISDQRRPDAGCYSGRAPWPGVFLVGARPVSRKEAITLTLLLALMAVLVLLETWR